MNLKKLTLGSIVGGVLYFLLGWLIYGIALRDLFHKYSGKVGHIIDRPEADFNWLFLVAGNLVAGMLMAYIIQRTGSNTVMKGLVTGVVVALLFSVSVNCMMYATSYILSKHGMLLDVAASTFMGGLTGAVLGGMNRG